MRSKTKIIEELKRRIWILYKGGKITWFGALFNVNTAREDYSRATLRAILSLIKKENKYARKTTN